MSLSCILQTVCWTFILVGVLLVFAFFATTWDVISTEAHYCTRSQLLIGAECAETTRQAEVELLMLNQSGTILNHPTSYRRLSEFCKNTETCLERLTCKEGHEFAVDVKSTIPWCSFYSFYSNDFEKCGIILFNKTTEYECLDVLFNQVQKSENEKCEKWEDSQICVEEAIRMECSLELAEQYKKETIDFSSEICNPTPHELPGDIEYSVEE